VHYTSADTRQGFEFQNFAYDAIPEGVELVCDASANFGSKHVDISKYGVIYAAVTTLTHHPHTSHTWRVSSNFPFARRHLTTFLSFAHYRYRYRYRTQAHKNFSTSGVCYTLIRKDLINADVHKHTPTMCNWNRFQTAPNKIWNVPVIFSIWLGKFKTYTQCPSLCTHHTHIPGKITINTK
jgi:hypothetical protein